MSDGMGREPAYLSSHATNRYFIPNWGILWSFSPTSVSTKAMFLPLPSCFLMSESTVRLLFFPKRRLNIDILLVSFVR